MDGPSLCTFGETLEVELPIMNKKRNETAKRSMRNGVVWSDDAWLEKINEEIPFVSQ